jgi:acyl carrier protein
VSTPLGRLYRTGDLARVRDGGAIEFLGRLDFQVKVRGYRIELGEIEAALAQHADVGEAVVAARDEGGDKRLVAYFTAAPGATPSAGALRAHLRDTLPEHMIPSAFVVLDRMPLTANNKIDRKALPAPLASAAEPEEIIEPRGPVEATIATIFADVLGLARVGVTQDFFALGGHSLLGTRAMALLTEALGVELPLRALFEVKTVAGLAELVDFVQKSRIATEPEGTADLEEGEL